MSDQPAPVPQRIGDAERDRAAGYLREHLAAGRVTVEEFDERISAVLAARFATDLEAVFSDLPSPRPGRDVVAPVAGPAVPAPRPAAAGAARRPWTIPALSVAAGIAWPVVLIFLFATGSWPGMWWLVLAPVALSAARENLEKSWRRGEL